MDRQSPWLSLAETAALLNLKPRTLESMRWQGVGPSFRRHGGRTFYHQDDLKEWFDHGRRGATGRSKWSTGPLLLMLAGVALITAARLPKHPLLIWNASPSVPIGLYRVAPGLFPRLGDLALVQLTAPMATSAERRGYLRRGAYLLKPVAAVAGDRVCRFGTHVFVRGRRAALTRDKDSKGRHMPAWHGCHTLGPGEIFVLTKNPASFDSRYFGTISTQHLVARAMRL